MAIIKPFFCIRPQIGKAAEIAALPYDVYSRKEAKAEVLTHPMSFLKIDRAETQFSDDVDTYDESVYEKAGSTLWQMVKEQDFVEEDVKRYYIYELTMNGRVQTGIAACASIDDYVNGAIKKHENTRAEKEQDRIRHVDACNAQTGPIFLAYRANDVIRQIVAVTKKQQALYDFISEDGVRHRVFDVTEDKTAVLEDAFAKIGEIYIADGHHRAASAVKVGLMRREQNPGYTGTEEFNYFLSVLFPDEELMIMDYNRVVKDLNGLTTREFLDKVKEIFEVETSQGDKHPTKKGEISMLLTDTWYRLSVKKENCSQDPVEGLDVSLLQNLLLHPILGIADPKTDSRIDFVGGIRGMEELEKRVREDCAAAFAMYPTSIAELFDVADAGRLMPPKSTWFEPKLRSGLFIHKI